jgi:LCP family protein required for cell wall assembly
LARGAARPANGAGHGGIVKKTLFLLGATVLMTGILFVAGVNVLSALERYDEMAGFEAAAAQAQSGAQAAGGGAQATPSPQDEFGGLGLFRPMGAEFMGDFALVLKSFKPVKSDPFNLLVLVADTSSGNTDGIVVMHYNPKTVQVNMVAIPRDTYVTVKGLKDHKINSVYKASNGIERLETVLEDILGQPIDYYVHIEMKTVREIVDVLGGVDYDVPCDMAYEDYDQDLYIDLKKGFQHMDGAQVEQLLRFRHPTKWTDEVRQYYDGSDVKRIERQQDFLREALQQKMSIQYIPKITEVIQTVYANVQTDLPMAEMLKLASGITGFDAGNYRSETLPGEFETRDRLSYYVYYTNKSRQLAEELLKEPEPAETEAPQVGGSWLAGLLDDGAGEGAGG